MIPLPIISQPFQRMAMDIVGPLPRSRQVNRYILVVCDYATRYPEAVPMKNIDAGSIADELIKIFSRVGVPQLIREQISPHSCSLSFTRCYISSPTSYHPQTDGLVERFNQTLKLMLRKTAVKEGLDWDRMFSLLTEKFHRRQLDFHPLNYFMAIKYVDHWTY